LLVTYAKRRKKRFELDDSFFGSPLGPGFKLGGSLDQSNCSPNSRRTQNTSFNPYMGRNLDWM